MINRRPFSAFLSVTLTIFFGVAPAWSAPPDIEAPAVAERAAEMGPQAAAAIPRVPLEAGGIEIPKDRLYRLTASQEAIARPLVKAAEAGALGMDLSPDHYTLTYNPDTHLVTVSLNDGATARVALVTSQGSKRGVGYSLNQPPLDQRQEVTSQGNGGVKFFFGPTYGEKSAAFRLEMNGASFNANRSALIAASPGGHQLPNEIPTAGTIALYVTSFRQAQDEGRPLQSSAPAPRLMLEMPERPADHAPVIYADRGPVREQSQGFRGEDPHTAPVYTVNGRAPLAGMPPTIDSNYRQEAWVDVQASDVHHIPTIGSRADTAHLESYLSNFRNVTRHKYIPDGPKAFVCAHFAKELARGINNDAKNPGYAAFVLAYWPVVKMDDRTLDRTRGASDQPGVGHAINVIEVPIKSSTQLSKYWLVEPNGASILGSFIAARGNPMPPAWFLKSFLDSDFNRAVNYTAGPYRVLMLGENRDY